MKREPVRLLFLVKIIGKTVLFINIMCDFTKTLAYTICTKYDTGFWE